jgi:membrane protein implicated in regulation of membrane protease activity
LGFDRGGETPIIEGSVPPLAGAGAVEQAMPQLIFFVIIIAVAYYGYKAFVREAERVSAKIRRQEKQASNGTIGTLVKDPVTGEYRLAKD